MQAFKARDIPCAVFLMGAYLDHMRLGILEGFPNGATGSLNFRQALATGN
jgi:hypothetical protein